MSVRSSFRTALRWLRRAQARRKARLASLTRADEHLMEVTKRERDAGAPFDSWRQVLPYPRRGVGF